MFFITIKKGDLYLIANIYFFLFKPFHPDLTLLGREKEIMSVEMEMNSSK